MKQWNWNNGTTEQWIDATMEQWNWNNAIMELEQWNNGTMEKWNN